MDYLRTRSGRALHPVGMGTWTFGDAAETSPRAADEVAAIRQALHLGQNHIDTAERYADGGAEHVVGRAIEGLGREDFFIASKLWKPHVARDTVRPAVDAMLRRLGTDYLDLLYIHHPWRDAPWREALPQIDTLIDEGVVRYLGVSNFDAGQLREASTLAGHRIAVNQIRFSCSQRTALDDELSHLCRVNGTSVVAYRPLDQGNLAANGIITDIAKRREATAAQVALAWLVARQALPIPRASRLDHVKQNAAVVDIQLSTEDIAHIDRSF